MQATNHKPSWAIVGGAVGLACLTGFILERSVTVPREAALMAGIFVLAAVLWVTEALPLFVTSLLVIGLQAVLLANPGNWPGMGFESKPSPSYREILSTAADPVLVLFFGGFVMAHAAVKEGVDRAMSVLLLKPFGNKPRWVLQGLLLITMLFSMWMSNTATAAMMLTLIMPMLAAIPPQDPFRKALVLSIPFAANIGGISTPIASPPNAVAIRYLQESGKNLAFLDWMLVAVPLAFGLILATWFLLWKFFAPKAPVLVLERTAEKLSRRGMVVVSVFVVTVILWITDQWHGLPPSIVALLPAIVLAGAGIFNRDDLNRLEWRILILIAGGISLGSGMQATGLGNVALQLLPVGSDNGLVLLGSLVVGTIAVGTFMSNTAAANLLLPVGISAAGVANSKSGLEPVEVVMSIALAASMSMFLPISTPPNAMAHGVGETTTGEMARAGFVIGAIGAAAIVFGIGFVMKLLGLME